MTRRVHHVQDVRALARHAVQAGAVASGNGAVLWDVSGNCSDPRTFTIEGRWAGWGVDPNRAGARPFMGVEKLSYEGFSVGGQAFAHWVDMTVRCRKCPTCLRFRASQWTARARAELQAAPRTWFGTMTLHPAEHFRISCLAEVQMRARGTEWRELSPDEQFYARHSLISKEITKWLKRVRKESGSRLRYCLTAEAHKSGLPHYHILVHERWLGEPVTERCLRLQWQLGFSKFHLVNDKGAAWYVCKYLSKTALARVRASVRYGQSTL